MGVEVGISWYTIKKKTFDIFWVFKKIFHFLLEFHQLKEDWVKTKYKTPIVLLCCVLCFKISVLAR
jgi:hypothetical protein